MIGLGGISAHHPAGEKGEKDGEPSCSPGDRGRLEWEWNGPGGDSGGDPGGARPGTHAAEGVSSAWRPSSRWVRRSTIESAISPLRMAMFDSRAEVRPWLCSVPPWR